MGWKGDVGDGGRWWEMVGDGGRWWEMVGGGKRRVCEGRAKVGDMGRSRTWAKPIIAGRMSLAKKRNSQEVAACAVGGRVDRGGG